MKRHNFSPSRRREKLQQRDNDLGWPRGSECRATDQPAGRAASSNLAFAMDVVCLF
ncbi:unnamed protein product [Acanthoscelides obtectus]|uniref:Uncharacterized protein n=1 Tax=Acanthoscelides obtectus TaxID=200917 RepID=A0A9P0PUE2_ACAOB|nr:unnamed protein product [Acanthoscelides obtectus]CAK1651458.1 hypothetical protein AOBTE_LOCUS17293 [Acanthoscelides obtectus]